MEYPNYVIEKGVLTHTPTGLFVPCTSTEKQAVRDAMAALKELISGNMAGGGDVNGD